MWRYNNGTIRITTVVFSLVIFCVVVIALIYIFDGGRFSYSREESIPIMADVASSSLPAEPVFVVTHLSTPNMVKAIYLTAPAMSNQTIRERIFSYLDDTDINSVVIDVKDYSGRVSFLTDNPEISTIGSPHNMIPDIEQTIDIFHKKGIYVIARVAAFQDPFALIAQPSWAVRDSTTGKPWKDSGGGLWIDPTNEEVWDYIVAIGHEAYRVGFDEINFDYIRFPSDGNVSKATYSNMASTTRVEIMRRFFARLHSEFSPKNIPISGDIFGQVTSDPGDMGIGQRLEDALAYFDYVAPMVYPSHYINGYLGFANPADHPYEVIKYSMDQAVARAVVASTSPSKIRPWLQAFDYKATYTPKMVRDQMGATYDAGLNSWMLWNPKSIYDKSSLTKTDSISSTTAVRLVDF